MRIKQVGNGKWTVVHDVTGAIMLRVDTETDILTPDGTERLTAPKYLDTREEVKQLCMQHGLYEAKADNPGGLPEGTLIGLFIGETRIS